MVNSHKPMGACHDAGSYILVRPAGARSKG